jgi:hypothetical protein
MNSDKTPLSYNCSQEGFVLIKININLYLVIVVEIYYLYINHTVMEKNLLCCSFSRITLFISVMVFIISCFSEGVVRGELLHVAMFVLLIGIPLKMGVINLIYLFLLVSNLGMHYDFIFIGASFMLLAMILSLILSIKWIYRFKNTTVFKY